MTPQAGRDYLKQLGIGIPIAQVCRSAGLSRAQFDGWWREECRRRVPAAKGSVQVHGVRASVQIERDAWGIPHVYAESDADLFFGWGYATAQDRLFQLDFMRRKARGRLAEILGKDGVESDVAFRTYDLGGIADREEKTLSAEMRTLLEAYTAGINAVIETSRELLPIEFDLLDYQPEAWRPSDSLAIEGEFRWYLTVRFPVIVIPELAKQALGDGPLYHAFLLGEVDDESVVWPGEYAARPRKASGVGSTQGDAGPGSNNWVISGARTTTGTPIVASDPHIPFQAVSMWHEVHLSGGAFHVAGVCLAGLPGVMIGRNREVAWGITNNICSLRDLYQESTDPTHPGCFLYDGAWEEARTREETIQVRDADPVRRTVVASRNGPIVDDLLPLPARTTGPVSLRWLGFEPCGWMTALIQSNRAKTCSEFREALSPWQAPTFNLVFADADGHIGFQSVGRIPIRNKPERGYRPGWDPAHQWDSVIPFDGMPRLADPERGFVVTANNRVAPDDFPYPLAGAWSSGHRARRIRQSLQVNPKMSAKDCTLLQQDIHSGRAALGVPRLLNLIGDAEDEPTSQALGYLRDWDHSMDTASVAAAIFHVFFSHWCRVVASERFPAEQSAFVAANAGGLAIELLADDALGWFVLQDRVRAVRRAFVNALGELGEKLGPDMAQWTWGRLHTLNQKHYLSGRGDLGILLDLSGLAMRGDGVTVCSSTPDASHQAWLGAGYRMVADLADPKQTLLAMEIAGASGHPGSPHYSDQIAPWERFEYHAISLASDKPSGGNVLVLVGK